MNENMINDIFNGEKIVPGVIDVAPLKTLKVKYLQSNKEVKLGNELTPNDTSIAPSIQFEADPNGYYTFMMVDPDAPSRKMSFLGEVIHWLVVNIVGADIASGETIRNYIKCGPPMFTGLHRYIFLVFKQPEKIIFNEPHSADTRIFRVRFSTKKFANKYNLGNPISGNFFQAQH